jgi:uncharacterized small protein (DUF1192 family)
VAFILRKPLLKRRLRSVRGIREEDVTGQNPTERAEEDVAASVADIEQRIEALAEEIGRLIVSGPTGEREALHDYAVSLVREKLPVVDPTPAVHDTLTGDVTVEAASNTATLLGYGVLLIPVGFLMLLVFAPLGALLLVAAVGMAVAGVVLALIGRVRRA